MDKVLKNLGPLVLVIALGLKGVISGINIADASVAVALTGLLSLREYLERNREYTEMKETVDAKVKAIEATVELQNKVIKEQAIEFDKLRNSMSGIKLQFGAKEAFSQQPKKII